MLAATAVASFGALWWLRGTTIVPPSESAPREGVRPDLSEILHNKGWAEIDLPSHRAVSALVTAAEQFFKAAQAEKDTLGGVRAVHLAGYYATGLRQQLEVRHDAADPSVLSPKIDDVCPQLGEAIRQAWPVLETKAIDVLRASATQIGADPQVFLDLLDSPQLRRLRAKQEACGTLSVHSIRICRYHDAPSSSSSSSVSSSSSSSPSSSSSSLDVVCPAHTDVGFATMILQSAVPGLECQDADGTWCGVEGKQEGGKRAVWLVADCLKVLTNGYYPAAPHRVVRSPACGGGRISISFHLYCESHAIISPSLLPSHVVGPSPPAALRVASVSLLKKKINAAETKKAEES